MRQLIHADEEKLGALVLIDIIFIAAVTEAGGRTVLPRHQMFRFVVAFVFAARHVAPELRK